VNGGRGADRAAQACAPAADGGADLARLAPLLGRPIAFHRRLVDLTASVKAALLLSQALYWTRHGRDVAQNDGWFHKTTDQWERETGLTPKEQASARRVLRELGILHERRIGLPARLHFRLDVEALAVHLAQPMGRAPHVPEWDDRIALAELLGPTLAYHRRLAAVAGGVNAGLLLSRALQLTRAHAQRDGWFVRSSAQWTEDLGLTRREQETARRDLAAAGLWEQYRIGMRPQMVARVRLDRLLNLLVEPAEGPCDPGIPACGGASDTAAQKGESRMRESHIQVSPKAPSLFRPNRHHSFDKSAIHYMELTTSNSLQPPHAPEAVADALAKGGGGELILPERLVPEERAAVAKLVQGCPEHAQALLDELAARIEGNTVKTSAVAYLRGMVRRAQAGTFVPELGLRVAAARRARAEETLRREREQAESRRFAEERASPEHQARVAERRHELRRVLETLSPAGRRQ